MVPYPQFMRATQTQMETHWSHHSHIFREVLFNPCGASVTIVISY